MKRFLIICSFILSSCSTNHYTPVKDEKAAFVSFSNLSAEKPILSILNDCSLLKIDNRHIEYKEPTMRSAHSISIPAGKEISFKYSYAWFDKQQTQPVTFVDTFTTRIDTKSNMKMSECNQYVTFTPEAGKHYEVYFGKNIDQCIIKASETYIEPVTQKKILAKIATSNEPACRNTD